MVEQDGTWYCPSGDMPLSGTMRETLTELLHQTPYREHEADSTSLQGHWFCPRCSSPMVQRQPDRLDVSCPRCSIILSGKVIYQLVELHPHR